MEAPLTKPKKKGWVLAGDIGGTQTRLGLFTRKQPRPRLEVCETYSSREAAGLEEIIQRFVEKHTHAILSACFGVAGPVEDGRCRTTNLPWEVSEKQLQERFDWDRVHLINDLQAMGHAVPLLSNKELVCLNRGVPHAQGPRGLIAPGTGLGMTLLMRSANETVPWPSEGGHSDFAPTNETECRLWQYLHQRWGHVSLERLLSGPGLFNIYSWLKDTGQETAPPWLAQRLADGDPAKAISEAALQRREPICVRALDLFVAIFGAAAGNLALIGLTRGGIYLGGGIAPKILPKLQESRFMEAFVDKGRFQDLMRQIPVQVIVHEQPALLGAAVAASGVLRATGKAEGEMP
ncbi:MAG: glucokinase [Desulfobacterales bacterium]|nr:MAG: glucokinase [Desulfobacterales bacterium]